MTVPAAAAVPHPTTVGNTFVKQYYNLLTESPEKLHRFYKEESTFSHGLGSHPEESVSGQAAINSTILKKHYNGAVVQLDHGSIDCQGSQQGGVVVLVTGVITLQRTAPSHFVQSFFLAVQENGYFVLNDVLRILSIPTAKQQQPASPKKAAPAPSPSKATQTQVKEQAVKSPKHQPTPVTVASPPLPASKAPHVDVAAHILSPKHAAHPASPAKKPSTPKPSTPKPAAVASPVVVHEEPKAARPASPKKDEKHVQVVSPKNNKPKQTKPTKSHEEEQAAAPAPAADPSAPKSWASLFSSGAKKVSAVTAVASAASAKVESPRKKQQPAPTASWDEEASPAVASPPPAPTAAPGQKPARPVYFSLYIKQVPAPTTSQDLKELFKSYGKIAVTNVNESKGHAFVDFYDEESMKSVLAAVADGIEFSIHGHALNVVERVSKDKASFTSGGRGGRGRGSGEGGYPAGGRGGRGGFNSRPKDGAAPSGRSNGGRDGKPGGRGGRGGGYQGAN